MSRIGGAFDTARRDGRFAFIPYLTAGDPSPEHTIDLVLTLERGGADMVELGVPFSDPMADGEVNQRAAARAVAQGVGLISVLDMADKLRTQTNIPIVLFTYLNPVLKMGYDRFAQRAAEVGVDGVLVTDLPPGEEPEYQAALSSSNIDTIFMLAPTSTTQRIKSVGDACRGFIYYVSRTGVTGASEHLSGELAARIQEIKKITGKPVAVGFGISNRRQVEEVGKVSDGVVVGSALVKVVEEFGKSPDLTLKLAEKMTSLLPAEWRRNS